MQSILPSIPVNDRLIFENKPELLITVDGPGNLKCKEIIKKYISGKMGKRVQSILGIWLAMESKHLNVTKIKFKSNRQQISKDLYGKYTFQGIMHTTYQRKQVGGNFHYGP